MKEGGTHSKLRLSRLETHLGNDPNLTPHTKMSYGEMTDLNRDAKIQLLKENGSKHQSPMKQAKFLKQYRGGTCVAQLVRVSLLLRSRSGGPAIEPRAGLPAP